MALVKTIQICSMTLSSAQQHGDGMLGSCARKRKTAVQIFSIVDMSELVMRMEEARRMKRAFYPAMVKAQRTGKHLSA